MQTERILLTTTIAAAGALTAKRFVTYSGLQAVATDVPLGVANAAYDAGEQAGIDTHGEILVEAGAAIALGAQVQPDAQGRAITLAAGTAFGRARDAATAAGDFIRVIR
jgi:hypothetical protein